ncbi:MAG: hypothetical protein WA702_25550 [Bradyrhizobium sp.]|jgi:hypothetical protein|uniref:hypothetical protein n=1 Tax=Bradyrhizobium sp. TaxID=376 RepID=UPI003C79E77B
MRDLASVMPANDGRYAPGLLREMSNGCVLVGLFPIRKDRTTHKLAARMQTRGSGSFDAVLRDGDDGAIVLASPHFPSSAIKFYKSAASGNTRKDARCYLVCIRTEPPKQFGQGPVRTDSQNHSGAPGHLLGIHIS